MGKPSRRRVSTTTRLEEDWQFFYVKEGPLNIKGDGITTCLQKYGCGGWTSPSSKMTTALLFLDDTRSAANSWILAVKHKRTQVQILQCEEDTYTFTCCAKQGGGQLLAEALAATKFDILV